jgi:REP element-mobilizing transposase RayT
LHRYHGSGFLHFITTSCYHCRPLLDSAARRNLFLKILEQVSVRYRFAVVGYVVMPEHIHLLISEPERGTPSTVMQVLKQRFAHTNLLRSRSSDCHNCVLGAELAALARRLSRAAQSRATRSAESRDLNLFFCFWGPILWEYPKKLLNMNWSTPPNSAISTVVTSPR